MRNNNNNNGIIMRNNNNNSNKNEESPKEYGQMYQETMHRKKISNLHI